MPPGKWSECRSPIGAHPSAGCRAGAIQGRSYLAERSMAATAPIDPVNRFKRWFKAAHRAGEPYPEAMALATANPAGGVAVRFVLLTGMDAGGFVFYPDLRSRKGRDLVGKLVRRPGLLLASDWPPGANRGNRRTFGRGRRRRLLGDAPGPKRDLGMRIAAKRAARGPRVISAGGAFALTATSRPQAAAPRLLDRASADAAENRVLDSQTEPLASPRTICGER